MLPNLQESLVPFTNKVMTNVKEKIPFIPKNMLRRASVLKTVPLIELLQVA